MESENFFDLKKIPCFGVAGNFTGHLEQAGEAGDFTGIKTAERNAPKGIFPTYIPWRTQKIPEYLNEFPFDAEKIIFPEGEEKIQIEPECALICSVEWREKKMHKIFPEFFGASNDCSIRKAGAKKISMKKNWGASSKGLSRNLIPVDEFSERGKIGGYKICSFLLRGKKIFQYGEESSVKNYSYIFETLTSWAAEKFNTQKDEGPLENLHEYFLSAEFPARIMISIGATRYTEFGEKNFLNAGDVSFVTLYPESRFDKNSVAEKILDGTIFAEKEISVLAQKIVL